MRTNTVQRCPQLRHLPSTLLGPSVTKGSGFVWVVTVLRLPQSGHLHPPSIAAPPKAVAPEMNSLLFILRFLLYLPPRAMTVKPIAKMTMPPASRAFVRTDVPFHSPRKTPRIVEKNTALDISTANEM